MSSTETTTPQTAPTPDAPVQAAAEPSAAGADAVSGEAAGEATASMDGAVILTEMAAEKVLEIRDAESIEEHYALRVKVMGGGCSGFQYDLYFDEQVEGDYIYESQDIKLIVDQMSFMYLMGTEIDYVEGLQGAGFKFGNPNSTGSCGCGSSFSV
jgi:iron-sulfur cluster assembly accessory protein